jgi:cytoskeleton protein RodZ
LAQTPPPADSAENAETATGSVGPLLRKTRQDQGKDVAAIAETLRIRREHLQAIEDSRYESLPGPTYAVGFVRAYAEYLGLDGAEVVRRFKAEGQALPRGHDLSFPSPVREGGIPSGALIVIALLLAGVVYGGWQLSTSSQGDVAGMIENLPDRFMAMIGGDGKAEGNAETTSEAPADKPAAAQATQPTSETAAEAPPASPSGASPLAAMPSAPAEAAEPAAAPPEVKEPAAPADPAPTPEVAPAVEHPPEAAAEANAEAAIETVDETAPPEEAIAEEAPAEAETPAPVEEPVTPGPFKVGNDDAPAAATAAPTATKGQVIIAARADAWIEVTQNGSPVEKRMLHRGDRYTVPQGTGMTLRTGNAGGTQILFNGKTIQSLGANGDIAKGVSLNIQDLERRLAQ